MWRVQRGARDAGRVPLGASPGADYGEPPAHFVAIVIGMKIKQSLWAASLLALCAVGLAWQSEGAPGEDDTTARRPVTVIAVRHAEKGADDPHDPGLTEEGSRRATALARLLAHAGVTHVYSTTYRRTQATVAPLATSLELAVAGYDPQDLSGLAKQLRALPPGSVAVVAGHSNTTPSLIGALGGEIRGLTTARRGPFLGDDEYNRLFLVTLPEAAGAVNCMELRYGE